MSEYCALCRIPGVHGICPDCGAPCQAGAGQEDVDPDAVVFRQCPFRTGAHQCQFRRQARRAEAMCAVHRRGLRERVRDLPGMLAILMEEQAAARLYFGMYPRQPEEDLPLEKFLHWRELQQTHGLTPEQAFERVGWPFGWMRVEDAWRALTGQQSLPSLPAAQEASR